MLLKNGIIYDGSGDAAITADISFNEKGIKAVGKNLPAEDSEIDCTGLAVSPGFIDFHSHNDWFIGAAGKPENMRPYLEQGITTHIGGNCGFGSAGYLPGSEHLNLLENNLFKAGLSGGIKWSSHDEYFDYLSARGLRGNLAVLAGSGTTRATITGYDAAPLSDENMKIHLGLLEQSLEQGALGVSFGMGYAPDIFAEQRQLLETMKLVKKHNKLITVHLRAQSSISGVYPLKPFGIPHNIISLQEFLDLAAETGVKMNISHLIFVGSRTWKTFDRVIGMIDDYRSKGADIAFDTYSHHCGATVITGLLPDWFMAEVPGAYTNPAILRKTRILMKVSFKLLGFDFRDMQLASANHPELDRFNGMFLSEISKERGVSNFDNYIDIARLSDSTARLLMYKYSSPDVVAGLMRHPASHFMTDSWVEPEGLQNPAVFGCFPKFLERAVNERIIPLEEAVRKMTGANADRAGIEGRGYLKKGMASDVVVFDPADIADNEGVRPGGIKHVFLNGRHAVNEGAADDSCLAGEIIRG